MFKSIIAAGHLAGLYLAHRGLFALRWGLDVARGYQRAADQREGILNVLSTAERSTAEWRANYGQAALDALRTMGEAREEPGPLGVGARLAIMHAEFLELRIAAENLRAEAMGRAVISAAEAG